jgi:hypothetical protein
MNKRHDRKEVIHILANISGGAELINPNSVSLGKSTISETKNIINHIRIQDRHISLMNPLISLLIYQPSFSFPCYQS